MIVELCANRRDLRHMATHTLPGHLITTCRNTITPFIASTMRRESLENPTVRVRVKIRGKSSENAENVRESLGRVGRGFGVLGFRVDGFLVYLIFSYKVVDCD